MKRKPQYRDYMKRTGRFVPRLKVRLHLFLAFFILFCWQAEAQTNIPRILSGTIVTSKNELVPGVSLSVRYSSGEQKGVSDEVGRFRFIVPGEPLTLRVEKKYIVTQERTINPGEPIENLRIEIEYTIPPIHEECCDYSHLVRSRRRSTQ